MSNKKVSIIIPIFNSEKYLEETLNSISEQTYKNWECICVDDGSNDDSTKIVERASAVDSRFVAVKRPKTYLKGGNSCRNYGFEISTGEYIQWFDSDDLMHNRMLESKVDALNVDSEINYVVCRTSYFYNDDRLLLTEYDQNLDSKEIVLDFLTYKTKFFTPGPMFRREFLEPMKLFNVTLKRHQEREFFFRVILTDCRFKFLDNAFVFRRMHERQLSVAANRSSEKVKLKYLATCLNYQNFIDSGIKDSSVFDYFNHFFIRNFRGFIRGFQFYYVFHSFGMLVRTILRR